jgi:hypothetical protein
MNHHSWTTDQRSILHILEQKIRSIIARFQMKKSLDDQKKAAKILAFDLKKETDDLTKTISNKEYNKLINTISNLSRAAS